MALLKCCATWHEIDVLKSMDFDKCPAVLISTNFVSRLVIGDNCPFSRLLRRGQVRGNNCYR